MSELVRLLFAAKVETIDLSILTPLVKDGRRLVILEILKYSTIDDNLAKG